MAYTDEQRNRYLAGIAKERAAYEQAGDTKGVKACDAELKKHAPARTPPRSRRDAASRA